MFWFLFMANIGAISISVEGDFYQIKAFIEIILFLKRDKELVVKIL